jgi:YidC/Oxa1 family membrane protein insertase
MIDAILGWIGSFLGWLDRLTGNYMIALFIFALIVEILLLPFGIKQQKNTIKQASLRPKEMAIRNRYKGQTDRTAQQRMSAEIQEMYQEEHFNQFSGCLPTLLQLPIIIALYQVVINPLRYVLGVAKDAITAMTTFVTETAENGGLGIVLDSASKGNNTIKLVDLIKEKGLDFFSGVVEFVDKKPESLSKIELSGTEVLEQFTKAVDKGLPDFRFLGLNLAETPNFKALFDKANWNWGTLGLLLIPVLTFGVYFASMKISRKLSYQQASGDAATDKATGCSNTVMDIMMPAFSVYITFIVPAAIGVYWIFKSIISTLRQFILFKLMPMPTFTEEEYKAAEREYAGKAPKYKKYNLDIDAGKNNPQSIFHQDDEDYVTPEENAEIEKKLGSSDPDGKSIIEKAPLKDDDRGDGKKEQKK